MRREKLDTQVRQAQIVQAALGLIAQQGLRRLSVGAVARRVGLVPSALYRHFRNKEEIVLACFEFVRSRALANLEAVSAASPNALERLERLIRLTVQMVRELQALPRIIFAEGFASELPARRRKIYQLLQGVLARLEEVVREGQRRGEIRADVDARSLAVMVWGQLPPLVILWHVSDGQFDVTRQAEKSWQVLRRALAAKRQK